MRKQNNGKKKLSPGAVIAIIAVLAFIDSDLIAVLLALAIMLSPFIVIFLLIRHGKKKGRNSAPGRPAPRQQNILLDDCPKPFCFHKDKGEHHVRRGREIDPWDRPDIDISKYQRRQ